MSTRGRSSLRRLLAALLVPALLVPAAGVARADGDPASDVLLSQNVFLAADARATPAEQVELERLLGAAARAGYPIRVALIASPADLGSVSALWRAPQSYAAFLGQELALPGGERLLVVMPNGLGLYRPTPAERRALAATSPGPNLANAAVAAIERLARASGHPLPAASLTPHASAASSGTDLTAWIVFAAGALLIALAWGASLRARPLHVRG